MSYSQILKCRLEIPVNKIRGNNEDSRINLVRVLIETSDYYEDIQSFDHDPQFTTRTKKQFSIFQRNVFSFNYMH